MLYGRGNTIFRFNTRTVHLSPDGSSSGEGIIIFFFDEMSGDGMHMHYWTDSSSPSSTTTDHALLRAGQRRGVPSWQLLLRARSGRSTWLPQISTYELGTFMATDVAVGSQ